MVFCVRVREAVIPVRVDSLEHESSPLLGGSHAERLNESSFCFGVMKLPAGPCLVGARLGYERVEILPQQLPELFVDVHVPADGLPRRGRPLVQPAAQSERAGEADLAVVDHVKMTVALRWLSQGETVAFGLSTCDHGTRLVDLGVDGRGEDHA